MFKWLKLNMCLTVFALNKHSKYKLIMIFNRDESKNRESEPIHWLNNNILAGKDEKEGGSWFGITRKGRMAYLTNFRDPKAFDKKKKSRGFIIKEFLNSNEGVLEFLEKLKTETEEYNPFNLIVSENLENLYYLSSITKEIKAIEDGIHGLSNGLFDEEWPKVRKLKSLFSKAISKASININELFKALSDRETFPLEMLPDTGVGKDLEIKLSPIFVDFEGYGTVSSTVLLIDKENNVFIREKRFVEPKTDLIYRFKLV